MTREEKCKLAIERGYTYDPETGIVYGIKGKIIKSKSNGYIRIFFYDLNERLQVHHFGWYCVNKEIVPYLDHINGIKDDNRIINLRSVTLQQNQWNRNTAKGYCWCKTKNKWNSYIRINGVKKNLGCFKSEEKARETYLKAKEIYHKF